MASLGYNPLGDGLAAEFTYMTGYAFRGMTVQMRESDFLVIFKAWDDRGRPVVLFIAVSHLSQAWEYLTENYASVRPFLKFVRDKYHKVDINGNPL
jgi:hypothetical protein